MDAKNKILNVFTYSLGVFYLFSSATKSIDVNYFATIVSRYELPNTVFFSPIIISLEMILAFLLIFKIRLKFSACLSLIMLFIFTSIYAYGFNELGIEECGCFGKINTFSSSPIFIFIRNLVLGSISYYIFKNSTNLLITSLIKIFFIRLFCFLHLLVLYCLLNLNEVHFPISRQEKVSNTVLKNFIPAAIAKDRKILIFVFSPKCSHCWNQTENVKLYKTKGIVDTIIGVIPRSAKLYDVAFYEKEFEPNFYLKSTSLDTINRLTFFYPIVYIIYNNRVRNVLKREIPSPVTFQKYYK